MWRVLKASSNEFGVVLLCLFLWIVVPALEFISDAYWSLSDPFSNPLEVESYDFHLEGKVGKTDRCQFLSEDSAFQESW